MKKIDLHIHTVKTISDKAFTFSLDRLAEYVNDAKIDAIAITNHNYFDRDQFQDICNRLTGTMVFPGIEVNIGQNAGHMLVITELQNISDFTDKCWKIESEIKEPTDSITLERFQDIFGDFEKYLLIPHLDKTPHVDKSIIEALGSDIIVGEVSSPKKFIYCKKNDKITPVIFSDWRPQENEEFPVRQTYVDVGAISIKSLKKSFKDNTKVQLSKEEGHCLFQVLPNLCISTGLSVMMGGRSSGKTHTLNKISELNENIKYIKQFSLIEKNPAKAETAIAKNLESNQSQLIQEYLRPFSLAVSEVSNIDIAKDEKAIDGYIKSLIKYASETERADAFSKCKLFSETEFGVEDLSGLSDLISAVEKLLDARKYKDIIESNIDRTILVKLHEDLIRKHIQENVLAKKKAWINKVIESVKTGLQSKTSSTRVKDANFYEIQMNRKKVKQFNQLAELIKQKSVIYEKDIEGFKVRVSKRPFNGAGELKEQSGKKISFKEAYIKYNSSAYDFLTELKDTEVMDEDYYRFFAKIDYDILNQYGFPISGGERAEFNLLQEINDALQYDMLLIDEPESSFDNIFLKEKVNHLLKDIAATTPVVIVTHNNTVGVSIHPDYLIHTKREINGGKVEFKIYTGFPNDPKLNSFDGSSIPNLDVTMDCLEAGREAYMERRKEYEMLED